ncbi:MAG: PEP-CTERM sorting domain-containing protein [Vicinamibacterales bacterium]
MRAFGFVIAIALVAVAVPASASPIVLTFEGVGDLNPVGNFYNGGAGTNYGVQFSPATLAVVDSDAGGSGNIANEPSADTVMFFLDANNAILNFAAGFDTGFSFFYSSAGVASVSVWDGLNGTGTQLGTLNLAAQYADGCGGDPTGNFCNWTAVGVTFAGTAKSINFGGTANRTAFDTVTFGSAVAGGDPVASPVPEPTTIALLGLGIAGLVVRQRLVK